MTTSETATPPADVGVAMLTALGQTYVVMLMTCRSGWKCEVYPTDSDHSKPIVVGYGADPLAAVVRAVELAEVAA